MDDIVNSLSGRSGSADINKIKACKTSVDGLTLGRKRSPSCPNPLFGRTRINHTEQMDILDSASTGNYFGLITCQKFVSSTPKTGPGFIRPRSGLSWSIFGFPGWMSHRPLLGSKTTSKIRTWKSLTWMRRIIPSASWATPELSQQPPFYAGCTLGTVQNTSQAEPPEGRHEAMP